MPPSPSLVRQLVLHLCISYLFGTIACQRRVSCLTSLVTSSFSSHVLAAMRNQSNRIVDVLEMRPNDAADRVTAVPTQDHFHSTSEHLLAGAWAWS